MNPLFKNALPILTKIEEAGFEAYFVGGAVRDQLLGRPISDVDIASSATPVEIKQIFPHTVDVGIEHGTVLVLYQGSNYEITTFRAEVSYRDFRRPDEVKFIRSLTEDLQRRDFTMNAMAMNKNGEIIDPFCGRQALLDKKIITVGSAKARFSEDALRMMRAIRFVSQLSFSLDDDCIKALETMGHLLLHVSVERKLVEFEKLLTGKNRNEAIRLLCSTNLDQYLPELKHYHKRIDEAIHFHTSDLSIEEMWSLLVYLLEIKADKREHFLRSWKLPVKKIREIQGIARWLQFRQSKPWTVHSMFEAGSEMIVHVERLVNLLQGRELHTAISSLIKQYNQLPIKSKQDLKLTGTDLMKQFNRAPGPWIKEMLAQVEYRILDGLLENENEKIREWVKSCNLK